MAYRIFNHGQCLFLLIDTYPNMHPSDSGPNATISTMATLFPVLHSSHANHDKLSWSFLKRKKEKVKKKGGGGEEMVQPVG